MLNLYYNYPRGLRFLTQLYQGQSSMTEIIPCIYNIVLYNSHLALGLLNYLFTLIKHYHTTPKSKQPMNTLNNVRGKQKKKGWELKKTSGKLQLMVLLSKKAFTTKIQRKTKQCTNLF